MVRYPIPHLFKKRILEEEKHEKERLKKLKEEREKKKREQETPRPNLKSYHENLLDIKKRLASDDYGIVNFDYGKMYKDLQLMSEVSDIPPQHGLQSGARKLDANQVASNLKYYHDNFVNARNSPEFKLLESRWEEKRKAWEQASKYHIQRSEEERNKTSYKLKVAGFMLGLQKLRDLDVARNEWNASEASWDESQKAFDELRTFQEKYSIPCMKGYSSTIETVKSHCDNLLNLVGQKIN